MGGVWSLFGLRTLGGGLIFDNVIFELALLGDGFLDCLWLFGWDSGGNLG